MYLNVEHPLTVDSANTVVCERRIGCQHRVTGDRAGADVNHTDSGPAIERPIGVVPTMSHPVNEFAKLVIRSTAK